MADTKKRKVSKKRRSTGATPLPQILDLTSASDRRPTIKLDHGDYEMRLVEELTFAEFAEQIAIGKRLVAIGDDADKDGVLEELQELIVRGVQLLMVGMSDHAAAKVTPGQFLRITVFFSELGAKIKTSPSESGSNSAPDANDSSEIPAAA